MYRDMLILHVLTLHVPDVLQHTSPDRIAQVLGGGLGVGVAKVDRPFQRLVPVQATKARGEGQVGNHRRPEVALTLDGQEGGLSDEGLGCSGLNGLCSGLLRLGDICASVLALVDAFPCPVGLCGECVDNLRSRMREYRVGTK